MSLALEARKKKLAQAMGNKQSEAQLVAAEQVNAPEVVTADHNPLKDVFEQLSGAMQSDLAALKQLDTLEDKAAYKAEALEKQGYLNYLQNYKDQGAHFPNIVLSWVFIWLVDLGRYRDVVAWLPLMTSQQQPLPSMFKTKHWADFVADQFYDAGVKQLENQALNIFERCELIGYFNDVCKLFDQHNWQESAGSVPAGKLFAMAGKLEHQNHNYTNALNFYLKAQQLNDGAGVKGKAKDIAKQLGIELEF
ncbi:phage terminase small subunit [Pseudoalteromonas ruthenica]|uniref:phage terminase small subunit n=1 Tax=Pseudoalteromonas ruthenica TaxID=151081 RepID=UPI00110A3B5E|nr:phage terminase small subunit [Pseudoalteromonas ruthenica]TMO97553.1 hypothetical protein CWC07_13815 [Pseudoalteromonas ruthenica]